MAKIAILKSQHLEVARLFEESLDEVLCMAGNPKAEDLLKVTDFTGKKYWCDEIEFINNIPEQKEVVINNVDKLVAEYCDSLLPHVNALCHKSILEIATWSYRQGVEEMIEKQGEQKHDDKVKPKFKVGDWIIYSNEEVHLITGFDDNGYFVDKECYIPFNCEGNMRLWTIADARDGDVLTNGDCPCIFKSINEENAMFVYCGINGGGDFATKSESKNNIWDDEPENYYPANKEQRDTLFAKMREAGYEWDVEKKELKEVEQKQVEYIRKDAFIKTACKWLQKEVVEDYAGVVWEGLIEDFKKYMEDLL